MECNRVCIQVDFPFLQREEFGFTLKLCVCVCARSGLHTPSFFFCKSAGCYETVMKSPSVSHLL